MKLVLFICLLDFLFGNWLFPDDVYTADNRDFTWSVKKTHRIFLFFHTTLWLRNRDTRLMWFAFTPFKHLRIKFSKPEHAYAMASKYSSWRYEDKDKAKLFRR